MTESIPTNIVDEVSPQESTVEEIKKNLTPRKIVKFVARSSVKFVVAGVVSSLVPEPETKIQRVKAVVGTYVIAGAVAKSIEPYVEEKFTNFVKDMNEIRALVKKLESEESETESANIEEA